MDYRDAGVQPYMFEPESDPEQEEEEVPAKVETPRLCDKTYRMFTLTDMSNMATRNVGVQPYIFEPESDPEQETEEVPAEAETPRMQQDVSEWGTRGNCAMMPTEHDYVCCKELPQATGPALLIQKPGMRDIGIQCDPPEKLMKTVATQLSGYTLRHRRSRATQYRVTSRDFGVCTLTFPLDSPLLLLQPTVVQKPSKRPRLEDVEGGASEHSSSVADRKLEDSTTTETVTGQLL